MSNINEIVEKYEHIDEVSELVGIWDFHITGCHKELKIKVLKIYPTGDFPYLGIPNLGFKGPTQADPYRSIHHQRTIEEALDDVLEGFFTYWKPGHAEEIELIPEEDW